MSWSINRTGLRPVVKASIANEQTMPASLKQLISDICDDVSNSTPNGIRVVGSGHSGGGYSNVNNLSVESVDVIGVGYAPIAPPPPA